MSQVVIRQASVADLDAVVAIEQQCFDGDGFSRRQLRYLLAQAKSYSLLLELSGQAVAYAISLTPQQPRPARLYSVAVAPPARGRGLASQLITSMEAQLVQQHYQAWRLEVRADNQTALQLYQQLGFVVIATLPGYYHAGADGLRLQKVLQP